MGKRKALGLAVMGLGVSLVLCQGWSAVCLAGHVVYILGTLVLFSGR
jgi:membrane-associated PAP2 superfamily phosphatase